MKFFSMSTLGRISGKMKALIPVDVSIRKASESFEVFTVNGVGFLEDFVVYSKIPAKYWHNASPGLRKPTVVSGDMFNTMLYGVAGATGTSTNGASISNYLSVEAASNFIITVNNADIMEATPSQLPEALESIDGGVLPERSLITPKQAFHELGRVQTMFSLLDIEKKIAMFKTMTALIRRENAGGIKATLDDIHVRLNARLKYRNDKAVRAFFDQFQNTTDALIENLLEKYDHLRIGPADDFIPEMPDDAMEHMLNYAKWTHKVTGAKPVFYLIAGVDDFKRQACDRHGRDPILLVQSPFGFYWQILGAWDEEMRHVQEL